jgi:hypothetical protein
MLDQARVAVPAELAARAGETSKLAVSRPEVEQRLIYGAKFLQIAA